MKTYDVVIEETLFRIVQTKASNPDEALDIVDKEYRDEIHVLTGDDGSHVSFYIADEDLTNVIKNNALKNARKGLSPH